MKRTNFFFLLSLVFFLVGCNSAGKQKWSYTGVNGPDKWTTLGEEFKDCGGKAQAPVNITAPQKDETLKPLFLDYSQTPKLEIINTGNTVMINYTAGSLVIEGKDFYLKSIDFHAPSEFTIEGEHYTMDAQILHANAKGEMTVICVMIKEGAENKFFSSFAEKIPKSASELTVHEGVTLDINNLLPNDKGYYTISGSLTSPPCTEGVNWIILKQPIEASKEQIQKLISAMPQNNNRPVQPLKDRVIKEF